MQSGNLFGKTYGVITVIAANKRGTKETVDMKGNFFDGFEEKPAQDPRQMDLLLEERAKIVKKVYSHQLPRVWLTQL